VLHKNHPAKTVVFCRGGNKNGAYPYKTIVLCECFARFSLTPQSLESHGCSARIELRVPDVPVSKIILNQTRIADLIGQRIPAAVGEAYADAHGRGDPHAD
jgi:hypothetical protein